MDIKDASAELYKQLQMYEDVIGISTTIIKDIQFIVIYLVKDSTYISNKIPDTYKGYVVKKIISGNFYFQQSFQQ